MPEVHGCTNISLEWKSVLEEWDFFFHERKYRSHILNCININQSEASIYSLLREVSDYSDNLTLV